ncbi:MAG: DNA polymerase I, partial [Oscillospiraceae bacterium]|nr:DNA polymerase I [Oscillospiraceae bacterium]
QKVLEGLQCEVITSDCKSLYKFTLKNEIKLKRPSFDILLSCYVCDTSETDYSLKKSMLKYPTSKTKLVGDVVENYVENVKNSLVLPSLYNSLMTEIDKNGQKKLLDEVEIPLAEVLSDMELCGFLIDREGLENFGEELTQRIEKIQKEIFEICGESFNLNSPKQLGDILFVKLGLPHAKKTKSGYSTNAEVLDKLRGYHPAVDLILEYRKLQKLNSTYVDGLLKAIAEDGRIHTTFNQTETRTGRISSLEPNLQNIPVRTAEGSRLREFFLADDGRVLVDADYSQIELRVLSHVANDKTMLEAFENGVDIHTLTASQVFGVPLDFVTSQMRSRAKAVNFGIVYGIGAFSLSKDIGVSIKEADSYIKSYLENFSGVERYMRTTIQEGRENGYVSTMFNRRRYMPELRSSNRMIVAAGERIAMNMPIQGTAADIIKIAMVRVFDRLKKDGLKAKLIMQVHDELIIEAPENEREQVSKLLCEEMENAVSLNVRLKADTSFGKNWLEAK